MLDYQGMEAAVELLRRLVQNAATVPSVMRCTEGTGQNAAVEYHDVREYGGGVAIVPLRDMEAVCAFLTAIGAPAVAGPDLSAGRKA